MQVSLKSVITLPFLCHIIILAVWLQFFPVVRRIFHKLVSVLTVYLQFYLSLEFFATVRIYNIGVREKLDRHFRRIFFSKTISGIYF